METLNSLLKQTEVKSSAKLPIVTLEDNIKVVVSQKAYVKISYLLQRIHDVEWSALMFYSVKGHITDPKEMSCRIEDIYLMDKGTAASTSHNYDNEEVIKAFDAHPEYMDMKLGHLHSHNTMKSYISSVDMDELIDNAPSHQYYLSLVVNNKGEMVAKVVYIGKQEIKSKITVKNKIGNWIKLHSVKTSEEEVLFVHDCNIAISIPDATEFVERFKEVTTKVKPSVITNSYYPTRQPISGFSRSYQQGFDEHDSYTGYKQESYIPKTIPNYEKQVLFAKALMACKLSDIEDKSIYQLIQESKDMFKGLNHGEIAESYEIFYNENVEIGGNNFILEAYSHIYKRKIEDVTIGEITNETEAALKLLYGEIGDAVAEAVDTYIIEINTIEIPEEGVKDGN